LAAEVVGSSDPVVFLYANVCDSRMWRAQLNAVGANNKAIAYDRSQNSGLICLNRQGTCEA
jgi:hypothetical protein